MADWLFLENNSQAATLLVSGRVSVSDALPLPNEPKALADMEASPAPMSLQSEKPAGTIGDAPWWANPDSHLRRVDQRLAERKEGAPKLKRPDPDLFVCRLGADSPWVTYRPALRVRLRNGRPDPAKVDPSLFAIEQIAERTLFTAELHGNETDMGAISDALRPVLDGQRWLRLGRGGAPVEVVTTEWAGHRKPADVHDCAYLTLTSDLLLRDDRLRWLTSLDASALAQIPGWLEGVEVTPVAQDSAPVHGFNGTARLWRQPAAAIRRGSVYFVNGDRVADLAREAAEGRWLGERTHEGFGRFRLDAVLPGVTTDRASIRHEPDVINAPDEPDERIAARTRSWFEAHKGLAAPGESSEPRPSLSQWLDLVSDLNRNDRDALLSRRNPNTAGKQSWKFDQARAVLDEIQKVPVREQPAHARMFVRWLRAEMRRRIS